MCVGSVSRCHSATTVCLWTHDARNFVTLPPRSPNCIEATVLRQSMSNEGDQIRTLLKDHFYTHKDYRNCEPCAYGDEPRRRLIEKIGKVGIGLGESRRSHSRFWCRVSRFLRSCYAVVEFGLNFTLQRCRCDSLAVAVGRCVLRIVQTP